MPDAPLLLCRAKVECVRSPKGGHQSSTLYAADGTVHPRAPDASLTGASFWSRGWPWLRQGRCWQPSKHPCRRRCPEVRTTTDLPPARPPKPLRGCWLLGYPFEVCCRHGSHTTRDVENWRQLHVSAIAKCAAVAVALPSPNPPHTHTLRLRQELACWCGSGCPENVHPSNTEWHGIYRQGVLHSGGLVDIRLVVATCLEFVISSC